MLRGLKLTLCTPGPRDPRDWDRMVCECLLRVWVSSGLLWGQGFWVQESWAWHKPSWRRSPLTHHRAMRMYVHRTGETDSGRAQMKLCILGPRKKSSDPARNWPRLACECPGVSDGGVGQPWPAAGSGALSVAVLTLDLLKEVNFIVITSTIVWHQVK